jgi:hypothetical protein
MRPFKPIKLIPAFLLLIAVFLLIFLVFQATRAAFPASQHTPLIAPPTLTPQPTQTPIDLPTTTATQTPRPTWTLAPTSTPTQTGTPTQTPTSTPIPTLAHARPLRFNDLYELAAWTPEQADHSVKLLQGYPNARFPNLNERSTDAYNAYYEYPILALREALLRFPDAPQAEHWRWMLAYNLARTNNPESGEQYALLINHAINVEGLSLEELPGWFSSNEQRMLINIISLNPPEGYSTSNLIEITNSGGAYLWILEDDEGFNAYALHSHFDFTNQITSTAVVGDLTGDSLPEVAVYTSFVPEGYSFEVPSVFSLSAYPPVELDFLQTLPFDFETPVRSAWYILEDSAGKQNLQFVGTAFPACPARMTRSYIWDGAFLQLQEEFYTLQPVPDLLAHCERTIAHSAAVWEPEVTSFLARILLSDWPPSHDVNGRPYPDDARDEMRFRLGIYTALAGDQEGAAGYLNDLISSPTTANSRWIGPANNFLEAYQSQVDLYRACLTTELCDLRSAIERLSSLVPLDDYNRATAYFQNFGVPLRSSGYFDFDNDGRQERWLVVQPRPGQKLEYWLLARKPDGIKALFIELIDTSQPAARYSEPVEVPPVVQIRQHEGFVLDRAKDGEPFVRWEAVRFIPTTFTLEGLNQNWEALMSGEDPAAVLERLEAVHENPRFNCFSYNICERFYYTLGLAYELAGQHRDAIDTYIHLWWEYSASPYTHLARLKVLPLRQVTPLPGTPGIPTPTSGPYPVPPTPAPPSGPYPDPPTPAPTYSPYP